MSFLTTAALAPRRGPCHLDAMGKTGEGVNLTRRSSVTWRMLVAFAVLFAFAGTVIGIALALLALPIAFFVIAGEKAANGGIQTGIFVACCWIPAVLLIQGMVRARPGRFEPPSPALRREQAPRLFALVDELAHATQTKPPTEIYLTAFVSLSVTETGGFLGIGSRRVLCIGAPLLAISTVDELRAGLAHELGHFAGGDTRLCGILSFTENTFRSVLAATNGNRHADARASHFIIQLAYDAANWVGGLLVRVYAGLYVRLTRPGAQRQELAADALSAALAGRETAVAMLEKVHVAGPLYSAYLDGEVALALENGVMPVDLLDGFARFRARFVERGLEAQLTKAIGEQKTDAFDTHPSLSDRIAFLRSQPEGPARGPDAPARDLLSPELDLDAWLLEATWARVDLTRLARPRIHRLRWDEFIGRVLPAVVTEDANKLARALARAVRVHPSAVHTFGEIVHALESGRLPALAGAVEPRLGHLAPALQMEAALLVGARVLATFFHAALVERGSEIVALLGESAAVHRYEGELLMPAEIATSAMRDDESRRTLLRWAERIAGLQMPGSSTAA